MVLTFCFCSGHLSISVLRKPLICVQIFHLTTELLPHSRERLVYIWWCFHRIPVGFGFAYFCYNTLAIVYINIQFDKQKWIKMQAVVWAFSVNLKELLSCDNPQKPQVLLWNLSTCWCFAVPRTASTPRKAYRILLWQGLVPGPIVNMVDVSSIHRRHVGLSTLIDLLSFWACIVKRL